MWSGRRIRSPVDSRICRTCGFCSNRGRISRAGAEASETGVHQCAGCPPLCCAIANASALARTAAVAHGECMVLIVDVADFSTTHEDVLGSIFHAGQRAITRGHLFTAMLGGGLVGRSAHTVADAAGPRLIGGKQSRDCNHKQKTKAEKRFQVSTSFCCLPGLPLASPECPPSTLLTILGSKL